MNEQRPGAGRVSAIGGTLLLLGAALSVLAVGHAQAASAARPHLRTCPTTDAAATAALDTSNPASALVRSRPEALQLCLVGSRKARKRTRGVILGDKPAGVAAQIIEAGTAQPTTGRACPPPTPATEPLHTVAQFYVSSGKRERVVTMLVCPTSSTLLTSNERIVTDHAALGLLWEDANVPKTSRRSFATPRVVGLSLARAISVAAERKLAVSFGGEWVVRGGTPGSVLLQGPWRGEEQMGLSVQVLVAVPPSPPCRVGELRLTYTAFAPQPPGTTEGGLIYLRDVGKRFCRLRGTVGVVGVDARGHPVTQAVTLAAPAGLVLSPHDPAIPHGSYTPATPIYATLTFSSPDAAQCPEPLVDPAAWDVTLDHGSLRVPDVVTPKTRDGMTALAVCPTTITPGTVTAG